MEPNLATVAQRRAVPHSPLHDESNSYLLWARYSGALSDRNSLDRHIQGCFVDPFFFSRLISPFTFSTLLNSARLSRSIS